MPCSPATYGCARRHCCWRCIRQLRLGEGERAYNTPEATCVVLDDFFATLDVPMRVDLGAKKASGWAFKESNRAPIDYGAMSVSYGTRTKPIASGAVRETATR